MQIELRLNRLSINVLSAIIVSLFFMSCNSYKKPVSLTEASEDAKKGYVKVTYQNGDQDVFEKLEVENGTVYGINSKKNKTPKTELKEEDIIQVEKQNKGAATRNTIFGVLLAGLGVYLITTML